MSAMFNIPIEPPADTISIIDKTASFAAKVGAEFEKRVQENEKNNPKFNFLKPADPYHAFYQNRVRFFRDQQARVGELVAPIAPPAPEAMDVIEEPAIKIPQIITGQEFIAQDSKRGHNFMAERIIQTTRKSKNSPIAPTPIETFVLDLPVDIGALDLDILKLTAQFVAKNGHSFQVGLLNREHKNPQFDFLKQNHPLHPFFLSLVESFTKCLLPPKNIIEKLKNDYKDKQSVLDRIIIRYDMEQEVERAKQAAEAENDKDKLIATNIDWYDFVVVETIDFTEEVIAVPSIPDSIPIDQMDEEMEVDMDVEAKPKAPSEIKIRKDYVKSMVPHKSVKTAICPKCGLEIPVDEMAEHIRIELLDPKYRLQKQAIIERTKGVSLATDDEISQNLNLFARKRGDIFEGSAPSEDKREKRDDSAIWDGHSNSIPKTINAAITHTIQEQLKPREEPKSSMPGTAPKIPLNMPPPPGIVRPGMSGPPGIAPPGMAPSQPPRPPPPQTPPPPPAYISSRPHVAPPIEEEPSSKRQKVKDQPALIPEDQFLAKYGDISISIKVQVPTDAKKPEWKLQGQVLTMEVRLKENAAGLKEKIKEQTGVPANKQKLQGGSRPILRDDQTFASYNLTSGAVLTLGIKERGGKNK